MALPTYTTKGQRVGYYTYLTYCGMVFFFLIAPIFIIIPLSFNQSPFFGFTPEMLRLDPDAFSIRWYRQMLGICRDEDIITTVCTNKWMVGTVNSFYIGLSATFFATALGTIAALGLSRPNMPFKGAVMALLISPMIVPLIITFEQTKHAFQRRSNGFVNFSYDRSLNYYSGGSIFLLRKIWISGHLYWTYFGTYGTWNTICCYYCYRYSNWL